MRLEKIISEMPTCRLMAEVGCDHALLTELALRRGRAREAIVSDISPSCLSKAKKTLYGYSSVTFLESDGIVTGGADPDCILICGMGGHTIAKILDSYNGSAALLLSPQSHSELVRAQLLKMSYAISKDFVFSDRGKFYELILAQRGNDCLDALQLRYGKFYKTPCIELAKKLERRKTALQGSEKNRAEIDEITEVLSWQK